MARNAIPQPVSDDELDLEFPSSSGTDENVSGLVLRKNAREPGSFVRSPRATLKNSPHDATGSQAAAVEFEQNGVPLEPRSSKASLDELLAESTGVPRRRVGQAKSPGGSAPQGQRTALCSASSAVAPSAATTAATAQSAAVPSAAVSSTAAPRPVDKSAKDCPRAAPRERSIPEGSSSVDPSTRVQPDEALRRHQMEIQEQALRVSAQKKKKEKKDRHASPVRLTKAALQKLPADMSAPLSSMVAEVPPRAEAVVRPERDASPAKKTGRSPSTTAADPVRITGTTTSAQGSLPDVTDKSPVRSEKAEEQGAATTPEGPPGPPTLAQLSSQLIELARANEVDLIEYAVRQSVSNADELRKLLTPVGPQNILKEQALHVAARSANIRVCRVILDAASRHGMLSEVVLARDALGQTALHHAALFGRTRTVLALLDYFHMDDGLTVKDILLAKAVPGTTALHAAAWGGHISVCDVLLAAGARAGCAKAMLKVKNIHRQTPLGFARVAGHPEKVHDAVKFLAGEMRRLRISTWKWHNEFSLGSLCKRTPTAPELVAMSPLCEVPDV